MKFIFYIPLLFFCTVLKAQDTIALKELNAKTKKALGNDELDSAIFYGNKMLKLAEKENVVKYVIRANYMLGNAFVDKENDKAALEHYFSALKLCKRSGEEPDYEGYLLNRIGNVYAIQRNYKEARSFFKEEIKLKEKSGDSVRLANSLINIASQYWRLNEFDSAGGFLERVRTIAAKKKDSTLYANYYNAQATFYFGRFLKKNEILGKTGNTSWKSKYEDELYRDSAEIYWTKSLQLWNALKHPENGVNPLFNLGFVYQTKQNHKAALKNYLSAKAIVDSMGIGPQKLPLFGNIAEVYYDLRDYKNAADYLRVLLELKDSLQRNEIKNYSEKLSKQYQLETNRTLVEQDLRLNLQNSEIAEQQKKIYLYVLIFIVLVLIIIGIIVYINFNKRVTRKVEEAKEKFFTNIMHEIRTPLSMIQAPLKTLKPKLQDEEGKYYISLAEKNVQRLNELINQMLDVSKIDSEKYKLSNTVGNLELFISEMVSNYEKLATEKDITFISSINTGKTLLVYDKDALEKIITNLLSNAIKYTKAKGSVGLTLNSEEREEHSHLVLEVWDTGIGIPEGEQSKVFNRFFRSESSVNKATGVGIGLSLVKDLVDAYNGKISFTSEENKGTRFTVELDLKHPLQDTGEVPVTEGSEKPLVLLVEDDQDILEFVSSLLKNSYEIAKARNGNVAKAILKNVTPDLIVTDLMMDELDGLSFIKEIKSNKGLNHIPVIVLSAKSSGSTRVELLNAGAQAFIPKPFLPEELISVIGNQVNLIAKIKKEFRSRIEETKNDQKPEEKFTGSEPYTQKLFELIFKQLDNSELSVEMLADQMATNRSHFQRKIKSLTGYSPSELVKLVRLEKAKEYLLARKGNITEVAYMCGFSSQSYFTKCFTQHFGYSPTQAINENK